MAIPLEQPFRTAFGAVDTTHSVLLCADDGEREVWSETTPLERPEYSPEWAAGTFACIRDWIAPCILGQEFRTPGELQVALSRYKGNEFAKAAIDEAWWLLSATAAGEPLYRHIGGSQDRAEVGVAIGIQDTLAELLDKIRDAMAAGARRIKLKMAPNWGESMLEAVRDAFPDVVLHVDCNSHYRLDDLPMFKRMDRFNLAMIEQPLSHDDLLDHAVLQRSIETPVCLDESITSVDRARQAIAAGSCKYINIKPGRLGGITNSLAVHNLCAAAGIGNWIGGMLETQIGVAVGAALGCLSNVTYPSDICRSGDFYGEDLAAPELDFRRGADGGLFVVSAATPGIMQKPDESRLARWTIETASAE